MYSKIKYHDVQYSCNQFRHCRDKRKYDVDRFLYKHLIRLTALFVESLESPNVSSQRVYVGSPCIHPSLVPSGRRGIRVEGGTPRVRKRRRKPETTVYMVPSDVSSQFILHFLSERSRGGEDGKVTCLESVYPSETFP